MKGARDIVVIILLLILVLLITKGKIETSSFIENRDREFKQFEDSLLQVNQILVDRLQSSSLTIDSLNTVRVGLSDRLKSVDSSIQLIKDRRDERVSNINYISLDSNIRLLSRHLSQVDSNR